MKFGNRPDAPKSKVPLSVIDPPIELPWPPRNLVRLCTTMSAPHSIGRIRYGEGTVLSIISGTPSAWATPATPSMSKMSFFGLGMVSPKKHLVLSRTAERHCSRSSGSSMNVTSMPSFGSV